jgi:hypothetical protein
MHHDFKLWPEFYQPKVDGLKPWEYRACFDRDMPKVGDTVAFQEWDPQTESYTDRQMGPLRVTYVLEIKDDCCVFTHEDPHASRAIRSDWERSHEILDAAGVLPGTAACGEHLITRLKAALAVWEPIGRLSAQLCHDLKFVCNTAPEVVEAVAAHRAGKGTEVSR